METISKRAQKNAIAKGLNKYISIISKQPSYHPINSPNGLVDLGVSENKLMDDVIKEKMEEIDMNKWDSKFQYYFDFQGIFELREAVVNFLSEKFVGSESRTKLSSDNVVVMSGAGSCFSAISHCIMEENEYMMIHTPFYSGISFDIDAITENNIYFVNSFKENNFELTVKDYEQALEQAKKELIKVKVICIVNPQNPLGISYEKSHVLDILKFAARENLHVIIDEIYANCIYEDGDVFESFLSYYDEIPDPMRTHFIWSFSKDLCLAGLRCGIIYSHNNILIKTLSTIGYLFAPSGIVQHKLSKLLNDKKWINNFFQLNIMRIKSSKKLMVDKLKSFDIDIYPSRSGFYLWVDFRNILKKFNENVTFDSERLFFEVLLKHGVYIVPGQFLKSVKPGYFRIIFSASEYTLIEGCRRIKIAIDEFLKNDLS